MAYIRNRRHRREVLAMFRRTAGKAGVYPCAVVHEEDGLCCRLEPWHVTAMRIAESLADDGEQALWVTGEGAA
jgi:hypothetical protein